MSRILPRTLLMLTLLAVALGSAHAAAVQLNAVPFPEKQFVEVPFKATPIAPAAQVTAEVDYRKGQARIDMSYYDMKPAILFGGDVTCFVVWAVTRDGQVENLGELLTRKKSGRLSFSTGKKKFALLVTAESYYLVNKPSELVVFYNRPVVTGMGGSTPFELADLAPAPRHHMDAIAHIIWDSKVPLDLLQARKAYELAGRNDAELHAQEIYGDAGEALKRANEIASRAPKSRQLLDNARRAVTLSNEALNISMNYIQAREVERKLAQRRAETEALERRAAEAELTAQEARRLADEVRAAKERTVAEIDALRLEKTRLEAGMVTLNQEKQVLQGESERLVGEKSSLESETTALREAQARLEQESQRLQLEKVSLETRARKMQQERDEARSRLQSALSHVADTQESARGHVINLPDILFDSNQATLKPEAQLALAKLAGILLIVPERRTTIEGHTDSTGSAEYNLELSRRRAVAVSDFLQAQGLDAEQLRAVGFGMEQPVADNSSPQGRKRNRRVEIVISEQAGAVAVK